MAPPYSCRRAENMLLLIIIFVAVRAGAWSLNGKTIVGDTLMNQTRFVDPLSGIAYTMPEVHEKVQSYVSQLRSAPTCIKLAARDLTSSCQTLSEDGMGYIRSLYAAKMAICELEDAGLKIPSECDMQDLASTTGLLRFRRDPKVVLSKCISALLSRPQSWTSYSNNLQNVFFLCQASRNDIEREKMIDLFGDLAKNNRVSQDALRQWHEFSGEQLAEMKSWAHRLKVIADSLYDRLEGEKDELAETLMNLCNEMGQLQGQTAQAATNMAIQVGKEADELASTITEANGRLNQMLASLLRDGHDSIVAQRDALETNMVLVSNVGSALGTVLTTHEAFEQRIDRLDHRLESMHSKYEEDSRTINRLSYETLLALNDVATMATTIGHLLPINLFNSLLDWIDWLVVLCFAAAQYALMRRLDLLPTAKAIGVTTLTTVLIRYGSDLCRSMIGLNFASPIYLLLLGLWPLTFCFRHTFRRIKTRKGLRSEYTEHAETVKRVQPLLSLNPGPSNLTWQYYHPSTRNFADSVPVSPGSWSDDDDSDDEDN